MREAILEVASCYSLLVLSKKDGRRQRSERRFGCQGDWQCLAARPRTGGNAALPITAGVPLCQPWNGLQFQRQQEISDLETAVVIPRTGPAGNVKRQQACLLCALARASQPPPHVFSHVLYLDPHSLCNTWQSVDYSAREPLCCQEQEKCLYNNSVHAER